MAVEAAGAVLTERDGAVLVLTMNRPDRLNALARPLREAMHAALVDAMGDDDVRSIVLTGAGRAFSAGGDLDEITDGRRPHRGRAPGLQPAGPLPGRGAQAGDRRDQRARRGRRLRPRAVLRPAGHGRRRVRRRRLRGHRPRARHRHVLDAAAARRPGARLRPGGHRAPRAGRGGGAPRAGRPRGAARRGARDGAGRSPPTWPAGRAPRSPRPSSCCASRRGRSLAEALEAEAVTQGAAAAHADFAEGVAAFRERRPPNFA